MGISTTKLPAILSPKEGSPNSAISMERALKQIRAIVEEYNATACAGGDDASTDRSQASLDDLDMMIAAIDRG